MPYQQNLGDITQADVSSQISLTWPDISSQTLTHFRDTLAETPPYNQAYITSGLWSRTGPGTGYGNAAYYSEGTVKIVTGKYGNWFQLSDGDYIPVSQAADYQAMVRARQAAEAAEEKRATDKEIKVEIAAAVPVAITWVLSQHRFDPAGITAALMPELLQKVKDNIVTLVMIALGAAPER